MALSKKVAERLSTQLRRYQPVLTAAKSRDINESDTVVIIATPWSSSVESGSE